MNPRDQRKQHCRNRGYELVQILRKDSVTSLLMARIKPIGRGRIESKTILIGPDGNVKVMARSIKPARGLDRFLSF